MMHRFYFTIYTDINHVIRYVWISGCALTYIAVIFNIIILRLLCRRNLSSPAGVLMQGLAISDGLTAFCAYGFEFVFQSEYSNFKDDSRKLSLPYPYCALYVHMSLLTEAFHLVSTLLTLSLGIQKCIAMRFPIWTRLYITKKKSTACCIFCFVMSFLIHIPRNFTLVVKDFKKDGKYCGTTFQNEQLLTYSSLYFTVINTVLFTLFCLCMLVCTLYIVKKFLTHNFRFRSSFAVKKRSERKSAMLVVIVLLICLVIEIPRVLMYVVFTSKSLIEFDKANNIIFSLWVVENNKHAMTTILAYKTDIFNNIFPVAIERWEFILFLNEGRKIFTLFGCMSNFVIYMSMSSKIRKEINSLWKGSSSRHRG